MDNLLALASELVQNDNYKKDTFQEEQKPDGDYSVSIKSVSLKSSAETGTEWFAFVLTVLNGEYVGEDFRVNLFLTEKTIKTTLSKIMKLISAMGYDIDLAIFNSKENILESLKQLQGNNVMLTKSTSTGGYINYSFKEDNSCITN